LKMTEAKEPRIRDLFRRFPELDEIADLCNEYIEARDLMDVRRLEFPERLAVTVALIRLEVRRSKKNQPGEVDEPDLR